MDDTHQASDFSGHGYVFFLSFAQGTKSESWQPFAVLQNGQIIRLHMQGDNPFENETLRSLHGRYCEFAGQLDQRKNVLLVSGISRTEDPFPANGTHGAGLETGGEAS